MLLHPTDRGRKFKQERRFFCKNRQENAPHASGFDTSQVKFEFQKIGLSQTIKGIKHIFGFDTFSGEVGGSQKIAPSQIMKAIKASSQEQNPIHSRSKPPTLHIKRTGNPLKFK